MTLKDIAELAGVSMMTVSNVINGKTGRVSQKTRDKINAIIKESGYTPNLSARTLTSKTSNIIGIVISLDPEDNLNYMENPYVSTMLGVIEQELQRNGYYTMIRSVTSIPELSALLKSWSVDGIIFLYPNERDNLEEFVKSSPCPVAVFDNALEIPGLINVTSDDEKGGYLSTKYLINHGHNHIAFVANYEGNAVLTRRFNGYRRALEEKGIPFRPEYIYAYAPTYEGGIEAGKKIASLYTPITAAVTTADICAIGLMEGARLGGLRIPIDLSVMGYDNLTLCQYTVPKLTSISQNITEKALTAVRLLLEKIRTGECENNGQAMMDVEIEERQSVVSLF